MATAPVKSQPLHNFSLPFLKWGQKNQMNSTYRYRRPSESTQNSPPHHLPAPPAGNHRSSHPEPDSDSEDPKYPVGPRTERNRFAFASCSSQVGLEREKACDEVEGEETAMNPWNLRPRKAVAKVGNEIGQPQGTISAVPVVQQSEHVPKSLRLRGSAEGQGNEKREKRLKFWISLSREEIEEDVYALTGSKPARRPKKRPKTIQKQLDACMDCGFFYLINHGVENELVQTVLEESRKFFSLPHEKKMKLARKERTGYTPLYAENLDPSSSSKGDSKETFYIGPLEGDTKHLNQWPSPEVLPSWRFIMEIYYEKVLAAGRRLILLIALALNLEEDFFEKVGALDKPMSFLRLLHYPGELGLSDEQVYGASAHSDYGMITLLTTDGVGGLQVCREKFKQPQIWEDVRHISGAFVINIGDMMERWTNCLYRSTLHRVMPTGQERYSMAFFLDPNPDCVVECLKSCCSEASPPRFPPIRSGDYLRERFRLTYS